MRRALLVAARLFVGAVFLYASASKLPDMSAFAVAVANYRVLPPSLVPFGASAVVGVELATGLLLLLGVWVRPAALVATAMLLLFIAGMTQALLRGINIECGCFGGADRASWLTVLRDSGFLVPAVAVALFGRGAPPSPAPR